MTGWTQKHQQGSNRGLLGGSQAISLSEGSIFASNYSANTAAIQINSTAVVDLAGDLSISGSGQDLSHDSTSLHIPGSISGLSAGATAIVLAPNSTGWTIGGAQISTA